MLRRSALLTQRWNPCCILNIYQFSTNNQSIEINRRTNLKKRRMGFVIGYVGAGFYGLQKQTYPGLPTIEGELEKALYKAGCISDSNYGDLSKIGYRRSSRTDKNVHASRIVLTAKLLVDVEKYAIDRSEPYLVERINSFLPESIRIFSCKQIARNFNPRGACAAREYEYILPLDSLITSMKAANMEINEENIEKVINSFRNLLKKYEGVHNFHNFTSKHRLGRLNKTEDEFKTQDLLETEDELKAQNLMEIEDENVSNTIEEETQVEEHLKQETRSDYQQVEEENNIPEDFVLNRFSSNSRQWQYHLKRPIIQRYKRLIYSCNCSLPMELQNEKVLTIRLTGDAFVFNQIRCMIGAAIATSVGILSPSLFDLALNTRHIIRLPVAPAEGLLLIGSLYSRNPDQVSLDQQGVQSAYGDQQPAAILLSEKEEQQAVKFRHDMIYPHLLKSIKETPVFEEWVETLVSFCPTEEEEKAIEETWKQCQIDYKEYLKNRKQVIEDRRKKNIEEDVLFKDQLPPSLSSLITVHFKILPGAYIHWIQRGLFLHMIQGFLSRESSAIECLNYIETIGYSKLAEEGKPLPIKCTAKDVKMYLKEQKENNKKEQVKKKIMKERRT